MRTVANRREHPREVGHIAPSQQMAFPAHCLIPAEITPSPDELTLLLMYSSLSLRRLCALGKSQSAGTHPAQRQSSLCGFCWCQLHPVPQLLIWKMQLSWESCWEVIYGGDHVNIAKRRISLAKKAIIILVIVRKVKKPSGLPTSFSWPLLTCQSAA